MHASPDVSLRAATGNPDAVSLTHLKLLPLRQAIPERDYWLEHCDGFRVDGSHGRIGIVEKVSHAAGGESLLVIRTGVLGLKAVTISTREVFEIVPRARRLWLRTPESASRWLPQSNPEELEPARIRVAA
jgi:hypothetical protein